MSPAFELQHIATGGTIDSKWDGAQDTAVSLPTSQIGEYLRSVARLPHANSDTLFMLDSRKMGSNEQRHVADRVTESSRARILATIGTYLMTDVARRVAKHPMARLFPDIDRRVVFTGATIPMKGFLESDGGFNLGMSVAGLQNENISRVSLVMNGCIFDASDAYKDLTSATFEGAEGTDQLPYNHFDLVTVGGSIDFMLDGLDGLVPSPESHVPKYLRDSVKMQKGFHAINPFVKDSRDLANADIDRVVKIVNGSTRKHIIITTGLYRMADLKNAINSSLSPSNEKCIVLTGSRIPLTLTDKSDAPFNLGYAMGVLGSLPAGAHMAINGCTYETTDELIRGVYTPDEQRILHERGIT